MKARDIRRAIGVLFAFALEAALYVSLDGLSPIVPLVMCVWILWALFAPSTGKAK